MSASPAPSDRRLESDRDQWLERARATLYDAFAKARSTNQAGNLFIQFPVPPISIESALRAMRTARDEHACELLWDPPEGASFAAVGEAESLTLGHERPAALVELRQAAERAGASLSEAAPADQPGPAARWFGGFAFAAGGATATPWDSFGEGSFILPRWRYAREGSRAFLAFACDRAALANAQYESTRREADLVLRALAGAGDRQPLLSREGAGALSVTQLPAARWGELVEEILAAIADGRFAKVVAARRAEVDAERPFDTLRVLDRLRASGVGCTRFALRAGESTFLGVTPERLVARRGASVFTEALAGSVAARGGGAHAELIASKKDRAEHAMVVDEITRRLAPRCAALEVAPAPQIRELRHLLHLCTPIAGRLREPTHVLDLVAALHPTPAVGGLPAAEALDWIAAREPAPRGWYAGPIGWFDAAGDGEFSVALRSAVVRGNRAWLWAGAGIVTGSSEAGEYRETEIKQRAILDALGGGE